MLYYGSIELLRVLIRGARQEDDDGRKDKMEKGRERERERENSVLNLRKLLVV